MRLNDGIKWCRKQVDINKTRPKIIRKKIQAKDNFFSIWRDEKMQVPWVWPWLAKRQKTIVFQFVNTTVYKEYEKLVIVMY